MTRREFQATLVAGPSAAAMSPNSPALVLRAIAGPRLPEEWIIRDIELRKRIDSFAYVERRRYSGGNTSDLLRIFQKHGMEGLLHRKGSEFLFGFESMAQREKAWRELNSDPESSAIRCPLQELVIYAASVSELKL